MTSYPCGAPWRLAFLIVCLICARADAAKPVLSIDKAGDETKLEFHLDPGATTATFPIYLRAPDDSAMTDVTLSLFLRRQGALAENITLTPSSGAANIKQIEAKSTALLHLKAANVSQVGEYRGEVEVRYKAGDQDRSETFTLAVIRKGEPKLKLQEGDPGNELELTAGSEQFSFPLTVLETAGEAGGEVQVKIGPLTRKDGVESPGAKLKVDTATFQIAARGYQVIRLSGTLPETTDYQSWIMFSHGKSAPLIQELKITRGAARFKVTGAEKEVFSLDVSQRSVQHVLTIQLEEKKPSVDDLTVVLGALRREDKNPLDGANIDIDPKTPQVLKAGGLAPFTLSANELAPGKYASELLLTSGGQTQVLQLKISRQDLAQNITIEEPGSAGGTVWVLGFGAAAHTGVTISESNGREAAVYHPVVESLERVSDNLPSMQLVPNQIELRRRVDGKMLPIGTTASGQVIDVPPRGSENYSITIRHLGPGKYKGRLSVAGPDIARQAKDFEIYVRHAFYWALLVIGVGVGASYWLHHYKNVERQKLVNLANVARTQEALELDERNWPEEISDGVWFFLRGRLAEIQDGLNTGSIAQAEFTNQLADVKKRRLTNIEVLKRAARLRKIVEGFPAHMGQQRTRYLQALGNELDLVRVELRQRDGAGLGKDEAEKRIKAMDSLIDQARKAIVLEPANALLAECERLSGAQETDEIDDIKDDVNAVITAVANGEMVGLPDKVRGLYERFETSQRRVLSRAVARLEAARTAGGDDPFIWKAFNDTLAELNDSIEALDEIATGSPQMLTALRTAFRRLDRVLIEHIEALAHVAPPSDVDNDVWEEERRDKDIVNLAEAARTALGSGKPAKIAEAYAKLRNAYAEMQIVILNQRIDDLKVLVRGTPSRVGDDDAWKAKLESAPLSDAMTQLTTLRIPRDAALERKEALLAGARADLLKHRLDILRAASAAAGDLIDDVDDEIESINSAIDAAEASRKSFVVLDASASQAEMFAADRAGVAAQQLYKGIAEEVRVTMQLADGRVDLEQPVVGAFGDAIEMVPETQLPPSPLTGQVAAAVDQPDLSSASIIQTVQTYDTYVRTITIIVATVGGVLALWATDNSWGEANDYLTALLWGFGLHEAGNSIIANLTTQGLWPKEG